MASTRDPDDISTAEAGTRRAAEHPGMPTWVKALIATAVAILVVLLIVKAASGGGHGPSRHGGLGDSPAPASASTPAG